MNDPSQQHIGTPALIRRFAPYLMRYKRILIFDLFCAALTTLCDIVLPKIMSYLTNAATDPGIVLTVDAVLKLALLYLILRLIDGAAQYFMSGTGHIMGVYIETDMRRDAFAHLQRLSHTYYSNTKVGQIMGRITNDLFDVTEFAHHCPEEFFYCGHQNCGFVHHPVLGQRTADFGGVCLRALDGGCIHQAEPEASRRVPPPAVPDRRAERFD